MQESDVLLVHTADLHIGGFRHTYNYLERTEICCDTLVNSILSHKHKKIIVAVTGDLLNDRGIKEPERNIAIRFIYRLLSDNRVTVVMVNGNHEYYDHSGLTMLHGFSELERSKLLGNIHVVTNDPNTVVVTFDNLKYRFLCVPCQQDLTAKSLRSLLRSMLDDGKYTRTYAIVHESFSGAIGDNGRPIQSKLSFDSINVDIDGYLLGDIHKRQALAENAWYCGSPWQTKYNKARKSGYLVWKKSTPKFVRIRVPTLIETHDLEVVKKYARTKHSIRYIGLDVPDDAPNVFHVPKIRNQTVEFEAPVDVSDINRVRAVSHTDVVGGLKAFLGTKAKLSKRDSKLGITIAKKVLRAIGGFESELKHEA